MASIQDVAARAGVSIATVSHVLNNTRNVRESTRVKVLAAIDALGYLPSSAARNLATGRSQIMGLVISDIRNPFFPEITTAFQEQAMLHELETIVMNTNYDAQRMLHMVKRLIGLQVRGVAILTSQIDASMMDALAQKDIPAVYLDLGRVGRNVSNIAVDYEQGIAEALKHVQSLGHHRVGFISGPTHLPSSARRKSAFVALLAKDPACEVRTIDSDFSVKGGYFACSKLLSGFHPTAILAANDQMAIGAMHCAYDRGIQVPEELSIVGFDDITFAEYVQPALTTVHVPRMQIGRLAFEALWKIMAAGNREGEEYRVETQLVIRGSTGLYRANAAAPGVS
jgi:DNA-binding LacI/PurR family transcriptional regulator